MRSRSPRITVAVLTYKRAGFLLSLLSDLEREARMAAALAHGRVRLLVVDNDPEGSGRAGLPSAMDVELKYVLESRRGISAARNRALRECDHDDVLVFIDDDERPDVAWLSNLLRTWQVTDAAAVAGPVRTKYLGRIDPWVGAGQFVDRSHRRYLTTGSPVDEAATNNLLLDLDVIRRIGLKFDESLELSGGEDSLFTRQLTQSGEHIVWCAEAWVTDLRPGARTTKTALLRRAYSFANASVQVRLRLCQGDPIGILRVRLSAILLGLVRVAIGGSIFSCGVLSRRLVWQAKGARLTARGAGIVTAGIGLQFQEYLKDRSPEHDNERRRATG